MRSKYVLNKNTNPDPRPQTQKFKYLKKKKKKKTVLTKCKLHISDPISISHRSYPFPFLYLLVLKPKTQALAGATQTLLSDHHQQLSKSISHSKSHTLGTRAWSDLNGSHCSTLGTTILVIASPSLLHLRSQPLSQDPSLKMNLSQTSNFDPIPRRS